MDAIAGPHCMTRHTEVELITALLFNLLKRKATRGSVNWMFSVILHPSFVWQFYTSTAEHFSLVLHQQVPTGAPALLQGWLRI